MFKRKGMLKTLIALSLTSMLFVGCSSKPIEPVRLSTPEETVENFNKYNSESNVGEMVKLYSDVYVDSTGYDMGTIQKVLEKSRKSAKVTSSKLIKIEDYNENIKKATIEITSVANDEEKVENYDYALIKDENGWSISPDGIIECKNYDIPEPEKDTLSLSLSKDIKLFEGGMIRVNVYNNSKNVYSFGKENNNCEIIVDTTSGQYVTTMEQPTMLDKKVNSYFMARITDLEGEINKITVTNIYEVDKDENILDETKKDIIVYEK